MSVGSGDSAGAGSPLRNAGALNAKKANFRRSFLGPLTALIAGRHMSAGDKARDEKRWREAAEAYARFLRLRPESANVWAQLGHCLKEDGKTAEAEAAYLKALGLDPEHPDVLLHIGRLRLALNDPASATHYFERASAFASASLEATRELEALRAKRADEVLSAAVKAGDEDRWSDAVEAYEAFLCLRPKAAPIWMRLGHCLTESGKAAEAERAYLKALELGPENPDTLLFLGRAKLSQQDAASAARYFERAAQAPSPSSDARKELRALQSGSFAGASASTELEWLAAQLTQPTNASSQPSGLATAVALRDVANLRANSKLTAAYIAELTYDSRVSAAAPDEPGKIGTKGRVCKQIDFSSSWFLYWANRLQFAPRLHRKLWEDAYVVQCLWERGCLEPGRSGLGFAVGTEPLPSLFASRGALITATDLPSDDQRSRGWRLTNQHASNVEAVWKPQLVDRETFLRNCSFAFLDMTSIPAEYDGQFDFCWSVCSFEHLGTLQNGLEFVRQSARTLKRGGVGVHTTEYNIADGETIDNWQTVLYQKKHFSLLEVMLEEAGCRLVDIDFDAGREFFDCYVDVPPFPHDQIGLPIAEAPHVKLSVDGFPATSIAIIVEKT